MDEKKTQALFHAKKQDDGKTVPMFLGHEHMNNDRINKDQCRCMGCMEVYDKNEQFCPYCGYIKGTKTEQSLHMQPGMILKNKYVVGKVLGYGGFGVTYIGWDMLLERKVAIKEYLPSEFATRGFGQSQLTIFSGDKSEQFHDGKVKFVDEAQRLAQFQHDNGIVKIYDSFEENKTAYNVMEFLDGETLEDYLKREKQVPAEKAVEMMMPVIEALNTVHEKGIIHRDIAPDNIILTKDGKVKLIDFGAARYATTSHSRSLTVIIKPGYSAEEQYRSRGDQGSHTDVYSVGAVLYKMITGITPPDALERRAFFENDGKDILKPMNKVVKDIPKNIQYAIENAMNVRIEDRTPDMVNFAGELMSDEPVKRVNGKIKKIDVMKWPLWAKIAVPSVLTVIIVFMLLLGFGIIGPKSRLQTMVNIPDGMTLVPDVVTSNLDTAKKELMSKELNHLIDEKVEDDRIEENLILLQNPDAGNVIEKGTFVNLTLSAGAPKEFVEDVWMLPYEKAKAKLEALGFKVTSKKAYDEVIAKGSVISQSVKAGQQLAKGKTIELIVSDGMKNVDRSKKVTIPKVTGMDIIDAEKILRKKQLSISIVKEVYSSTVPKGQIIKQYPESNTKGHAGDVVSCEVSAGIKSMYVPDVIYRSEENAVTMLKDKGFKVAIKRVENKEVASGTVFKQSIAEGQSCKVGTTITITVSKGYKVIVPNVEGKDKQEAQSILARAGLSSTISYQKSKEVKKNHIISQSIKAGTKLEQGKNVHLVISSGQDEVKPAPVLLSRIEIKSKPNKTVYYTGESLNRGGLKVSALYSNGTQKDVTDQVKVSGFDSKSAGTKYITVSYEEKGRTQQAQFTVTVKDKMYYLTVNGDNGIQSVSGSGYYKAGQTVYVSANSRSGYSFSNWKSSDSSNVKDSISSTYIFIMPNKNIELYAKSNKKIVYKCGNSIEAEVRGNVLYIYGNGPMYNNPFEKHDISSVQKVVVENGVTTIGCNAFWNNKNITSVSLPNTIVSIEESAFQYCDSLYSINFPNSLRAIEDESFYECKNLSSFNLPNSLEKIGNVAFYNTGIRKIHIPSSVISIGRNFCNRCRNLSIITVDSSNRYFKSYDNVLYTKDMTKLLTLPGARTGTFVVPEGVKEFDSVFSDALLDNGETNTHISELILPKSMSRINWMEFSYATNIKKLIIKNENLFIDGYAFRFWKSDQTIYMTANSPLSSWHKDWRQKCNASIIWGYK